MAKNVLNSISSLAMMMMTQSYLHSWTRQRKEKEKMLNKRRKMKLNVKNIMISYANKLAIRL